MGGRSLNLPALIGYMSWPGWIIAMLIRDRTDPFAAHHLNQALILNIISVIGGAASIIPLIGGIVSFALSLLFIVLWVMGIVRAVMWDDRPLPVIGDIHIIG